MVVRSKFKIQINYLRFLMLFKTYYLLKSILILLQITINWFHKSDKKLIDKKKAHIYFIIFK